jgi:hypothetical protein
MYTVWQTTQDDVDQFCCYCPTEQDAQHEVDRINDHLAERGIPGWVSSAYWDWFR